MRFNLLNTLQENRDINIPKEWRILFKKYDIPDNYYQMLQNLVLKLELKNYSISNLVALMHYVKSESEVMSGETYHHLLQTHKAHYVITRLENLIKSNFVEIDAFVKEYTFIDVGDNFYNSLASLLKSYLDYNINALRSAMRIPEFITDDDRKLAKVNELIREYYKKNPINPPKKFQRENWL